MLSKKEFPWLQKILGDMTENEKSTEMGETEKE